jgi:hypothetical protein
VDGLDEARPLWIIAERLAQLGDGVVQHHVDDVRVGPTGVEQIALRHQLIGVLPQAPQHRERLGGNRKPLAGPPDALPRFIDARLIRGARLHQQILSRFAQATGGARNRSLSLNMADLGRR